MLIYEGENRIYNVEELEKLQFLINKENEIDSSHTTTFSYKLEKYLISSGLYDLFDIINCLLSFIINVFYCINTYETRGSDASLIDLIEVFFICIIVTHFCLKLYISQARLYFLSSFETIVDLGTIIPIILYKVSNFSEESSTSYYLRVFKMIRFMYLFKLEYIFQKRTNETARYFYKLIFNVFSIILISSAFILEVENEGLRQEYKNKLENINIPNYNNTYALDYNKGNTALSVQLIQYYYHDMIYFTLVTLGTIGFGDITPKTAWGRMIVIVTIFLLLALIPTLTTKLFTVLALTSKYSRTNYRKMSNKTKHLILLGSSGVEGFEAFLNELYHEDHGVVEYHTVIMQNEPNEELMSAIRKLPYFDMIYYLVGNSLKQQDLERCKAESSLCVVLLANKLTKNPKLEDFSNILQAFSIKKYSKIQSGSDVRICMQLLRPETKEIYFQSLLNKEDLNSSDQVICVEEIKLLLLGKSCLSPGINTIVSCLITSNKPKLSDIVESNPNPAMVEYISGMQYEIYRIKMRGYVIEGIKFIHLVKIIYEISGIVVIGADCIIDSYDDHIVSINPFNYLFNGNDHIIYVLADKLPDANYMNDETLRNIKAEERDINPEKYQFVKEQKDFNSEDDLLLSSNLTYNIHIDKLRTKNKTKRKPKFIQTVYPRTGHESEHFSLEILSNHIIIVGMIQNMKSLIMPLRSLGNKNQQYPILIFDKEDHILSEIWKDIQFFPDVYYMQGNPIKAKDLYRAGIKRAKAVIILSRSSTMNNDESGNEMVDADIIFIYKAIRNENKNVLIITELASISTISFLSTSEEHKIHKEYRLSEQFAVGEIYNNSMLDTLMCQAFYNPYITKIIQQLILGSAMYNYSNEEIKMMQDKKINHSTLYLLNIYEELEKWDIKSNTKSMRFQLVFQYFIEKNMVPIGIYRGSKRELTANTKTYMSKYVFLMPEKNSLINIETDKIYVLACEDEADFAGKTHYRSRDITNTNSYFMKQLEKSNEFASKIVDSIKELVHSNQKYFKEGFSVKKLTDYTRQCLRKEFINIHDHNIDSSS